MTLVTSVKMAVLLVIALIKTNTFITSQDISLTCVSNLDF